MFDQLTPIITRNIGVIILLVACVLLLLERQADVSTEFWCPTYFVSDLLKLKNSSFEPKETCFVCSF